MQISADSTHRVNTYEDDSHRQQQADEEFIINNMRQAQEPNVHSRAYPGEFYPKFEYNNTNHTVSSQYIDSLKGKTQTSMVSLQPKEISQTSINQSNLNVHDDYQFLGMVS